MTSLSLFTFMHWRRKWQLTPVFLPGESHGWWGSLVGCPLWGHTESDTTEATQQQQQRLGCICRSWKSLCGYFGSISQLSWVCLGWGLGISLHPFLPGHHWLLMPNFRRRSSRTYMEYLLCARLCSIFIIRPIFCFKIKKICFTTLWLSSLIYDLLKCRTCLCYTIIN